MPMAEGQGARPKWDGTKHTCRGRRSSARTHKPPAREPGDLQSGSPIEKRMAERLREGESRNPQRQALEESDAVVVPRKSSNALVTLAEAMEERTAAKGNLLQETCTGLRAGIYTPTEMERVGRQALVLTIR